jgi:glycosyltransferase involved in cell wall biosynthesis
MEIVKNQAFLIQAFSIARRKHPEARLWLVGDGPLRSDLENRVRELNLKGSVRFWGFQKDIRPMLRSADVFVMASLWEGLPFSVLEAMAEGIPVVSTDSDGIRELVDHRKTGLIVPPDDPGRFAEAVLQILDDPGLARRMGYNARQKTVEQFGMERMIRELQDLYEEIGGDRENCSGS